jgi:hypothetical protein
MIYIYMCVYNYIYIYIIHACFHIPPLYVQHVYIYIYGSVCKSYQKGLVVHVFHIHIYNHPYGILHTYIHIIIYSII